MRPDFEKNIKVELEMFPKVLMITVERKDLENLYNAYLKLKEEKEDKQSL